MGNQRITTEIATKIAKVLFEAQFWINLQIIYDKSIKKRGNSYE